MITNYFRTVKDDALKEITDLRNGVWIHAVNASDGELAQLWNTLDLDETLLEDAQDFFEVPRMEKVDGVTYFFTRYPFNEVTEDIDTAPLLIVIGETYVLTVTQRMIPQFEPLLTGKRVVHTTQKTKLFLHLMECVTASFERQLVNLRRSVHKDRAKLRKIGNREIVRFANYERQLNDMVAAVLPTNVSLQQLMNNNYIPVYADDRELVEDVRIDNTQVVESARALLKTIQNVRNSAEAILTNTLNNRIKTLTVLTILLTIPTIIFSLYGMNIPLPFAENPYALLFVFVLMLGVVGIALGYFKKNDWL
jgi:magnesium transporter